MSIFQPITTTITMPSEIVKIDDILLKTMSLTSSAYCLIEDSCGRTTAINKDKKPSLFVNSFEPEIKALILKTDVETKGFVSFSLQKAVKTIIRMSFLFALLFAAMSSLVLFVDSKVITFMYSFVPFIPFVIALLMLILSKHLQAFYLKKFEKLFACGLNGR